jgi:hypothetical protein
MASEQVNKNPGAQFAVSSRVIGAPKPGAGCNMLVYTVLGRTITRGQIFAVRRYQIAFTHQHEIKIVSFDVVYTLRALNRQSCLCQDFPQDVVP